MAIRTLTEIITDAVAFIQSQIPTLSLLPGSVARDVVVESPAQEFVNVYTELQRLEDIQTLSDPLGFTTAEITAAAADVGLTPLPATPSTGFVTFRANHLVTNISIAVNTTISTSPTTLSPNTVSFQVTSGGTMFVANASSYLNPITGLYELQLPVTSVDDGSATNVAAGTINTLLMPITGITSITNAAPTSGGSNAETNTALAARIILKLSGNNVGTAAGIQTLVDANSSVVDSLIIKPGDPLLIRDQFGNSVNVIIQGSIITQVFDIDTYNTGTLTYIMKQQPVNAIVSVTGVVGGNPYTFIPVTDYSTFIDYTSVYTGSVDATSSITFVGILPDNGTSITVTYSINSLISTLQALLDLDANKILGSDVLVVEATEVLVQVAASITVLPGYTHGDVALQVITNVGNYINSLKLGQSVENSELIAKIQDTVGVADVLTLPVTVLAEYPPYIGFVSTLNVTVPATAYPSASTINIT
jgi:uncharacterized phage protein gp47/JayE